MENETKKPKRVAAPRKKPAQNNSQFFAFKCSGDLARLIESQPNKSEFIKDSIEMRLRGITQKDLDAESSDVKLVMSKKRGRPFKENKPVAPEWAKVEEVVGGFDGKVLEPIELPFFDVRVPCGRPVGFSNTLLSEQLDLADILCPKGHPVQACRVVGNSMVDAKIFSGDIAVVDVSPRVPEANEIALCEVNGEYTFKYFRIRRGHYWLVPANTDYKPIEIFSGDDFHIRGILKSVIRTF